MVKPLRVPGSIFSVQGINMWNSLPTALKMAHTQDHFKANLKQFLKRDQAPFLKIAYTFKVIPFFFFVFSYFVFIASALH